MAQTHESVVEGMIFSVSFLFGQSFSASAALNMFLLERSHSTGIIFLANITIIQNFQKLGPDDEIPRQMKVLVVINPAAGSGIAQTIFEKCKLMFANSEIHFDHFTTKKQNDAYNRWGFVGVYFFI